MGSEVAACERLSPPMLIYAITIFTGAFLLFQVEPLLARYILPWFGGTPAVWMSCVLFFQLLLVFGYAYSHAIATRLRVRHQVAIHLSLIVGCLLLMIGLALTWPSPITPGASWKPPNPDYPVPRIFLLLFVSIGLPYFILSTTGPLLQAWFARAHRGVSPYRLYALSHICSVLALVTYPFMVEPALSLRAQSIAWSMLFVLFATGVLLCARGIRDEPLADPDKSIATIVPAPARFTRILWIA